MTKIISIQNQKTFVMIKPDGVRRSLVGEILKRFEQRGLKIVALKMTQPTEEILDKHYPFDDEKWLNRLGEKGKLAFDSVEVDYSQITGSSELLEMGKLVAGALKKYILAGPVICLVVQGINSVSIVRKIVGSTLPSNADIGTIRGDFSVDFPVVGLANGRALHNLVHASETPEEAEQEINLWFQKNEIMDYPIASEQIMYSKFY